MIFVLFSVDPWNSDTNYEYFTLCIDQKFLFFFVLLSRMYSGVFAYTLCWHNDTHKYTQVCGLYWQRKRGYVSVIPEKPYCHPTCRQQGTNQGQSSAKSQCSTYCANLTVSQANFTFAEGETDKLTYLKIHNYFAWEYNI